MPKIRLVSWEELQEQEQLQIVEEEHSDAHPLASVVMIIGLESVPEEAFRQKNEDRRRQRDRWS